jgi:lysozyme
MGEINQKGIELIEKWEGFYAHAYDDGEGVWTIGFGTTRWDLKTPVKKGDKITRERAEQQLRIELQRVQDAIDTSVHVPLSSNEYSCLCSVFYNIGTGWCTGRGHAQATFIKDLNRGRKDLVPGGILKFTRGANSGKHYAGLLNRRKDEVKLWLTPDESEHLVIPVADGDDTQVPAAMPQAVAPSAGSIAKAAKESWTIRGAATAVVGTLVSAWEWLFGAAKEAGTEIVAIKEAAGPFDALWTSLHANMAGIAAGVVLIGCTIVIVRRLQAAHSGKEG